MQECRILLGLEERAVRDDIDTLAKPGTNEFAVHDQCPPPPLGCEVDEAADRVNDIIEVEYGDRSAGLTEATPERVRDHALARGDGSDDQDKVPHPTIPLARHGVLRGCR
jgi:hypothetical protein